MTTNNAEILLKQIDEYEKQCKGLRIFDYKELGTDGKNTRLVLKAFNRRSKTLAKIAYYNDVLDTEYSCSKKWSKTGRIAEELFFLSDGSPDYKIIHWYAKNQSLDFDEVYKYNPNGGITYKKELCQNKRIIRVIEFDSVGQILLNEATSYAMTYPGCEKTKYTPETIAKIYENSGALSVKEIEIIIRKSI